jgi:hypothetical protein
MSFCHLMALLRAHLILHVSRIRVKISVNKLTSPQKKKINLLRFRYRQVSLYYSPNFIVPPPTQIVQKMVVILQNVKFRTFSSICESRRILVRRVTSASKFRISYLSNRHEQLHWPLQPRRCQYPVCNLSI